MFGAESVTTGAPSNPSKVRGHRGPESNLNIYN